MSTVFITLPPEDGPIGSAGPPGPIGPTGPQGPQGPPGVSYEHSQVVANATWTINHNMGFFPTTSIFSVGGVQVDAEVQNVTVNQTIINFSSAFSGYARLN